MATGYRFICLALGALALGSSAQAEPPRALGPVLAEIDQGFVCPQFQPDDAARHAELMAFSKALATVGPTRISYRQAVYIRARMLERHNCTGGGALASATPAAGEAMASPIASPATTLEGVPN